MNILTQDTVRLGAKVSSKEDAIAQAGELLVKAGYVAPSYVSGMLAREKVLTTYLGNGIAIPHGQSQDLKMVHYTGVSVLQIPNGVEWDDSEKAYLVIGLAAKADEPISILSKLVELLNEPETIQQLVRANDPATIIKWLT